MVAFWDKESTEKRMREVLPLIIDEFVALYGEEFRETIEKRIAETKLIVYNSPEGVINNIDSQIKKLNDSLVQPFLEETGIEAENEEAKEIKNKILGMGGIDFQYSFNNIDAFSEEIEQKDSLTSYQVDKRCQVLQIFGISITPANYSQLIQSEEVQALMPQIKKIYQLKKKYEAIVKQKIAELAPIRNKAEAELQQKKQIDSEIEAEFLREIATRYPEKIRDLSDMKHGCKTEGALYCDGGIKSEGAITAFSKEALQELREGKSSFRKRIIRERQIDYLTKKGISITDSNYEEVMQTEECQKMIPSYEEIEEIEALREEYVNKYYGRVVGEVSSYKELYEQFPQELSEEDRSPHSVVEDVENKMNQNVCDEKNGQITNMIMIPAARTLDGHRDTILVHELIHAIEMNIGTDGIARVGVQKFNSNENRALNETKTQIIARIITKRLYEKGHFLFEDQETAQIKGGSGYDKEIFLLDSFMEKFCKEICEVAMTGNMEAFLQKVGKENFEKLSNAVEEHSQISIFQLYEIYKEKDLNSPILQKRNEIIKTAQEAVSKMEQQADRRMSGPER